MGWAQPLTKIAAKKAASRDLKDEELVKALMAQAGVVDKERNPSFLEKLSSILGTFEWTDDLLKTAKSGGNAGDFLKSYLTDIPKTLSGNLIGKKEWIEPGEGKGVELAKYLGVEKAVPKYILGTAMDILEPSMLISGAIKPGLTLTKVGSQFGDDIAKLTLKNSDEFVKIAGKNFDDALKIFDKTDAGKLFAKEFGEDAAKSATKRLIAGDDMLRITSDFVQKRGIDQGLVKTLEPGFYLGTSAAKGIPVAKGTVPSYIARMIDSPLVAPFEIAGDVARKTGFLDTKMAKGISKGLEKSLLENFDFQHTLKKTGDPNLIKLGSEVHGITSASDYAGTKAARELENWIETLPKAQRKEFLDFNIRRPLEIGGGLPQSTTLKQYADELVGFERLSKEAHDQILERMPKELKEMTFAELPKYIQTNKNLLEGSVNLEQQLGTEFYNMVTRRLEGIAKDERLWEDIANQVGYKGSKTEGDNLIRSLDDVEKFREAIRNSNLDKPTREFYEKYLADTFEKNIKIGPKRAALKLGDYGPGYIKAVYSTDLIKDLPEGTFKKNLIDTSKRTIYSAVDEDIYNEFSPYKLREDIGASGLLKQISSKASQDEAVQRTYNLYKVVKEQAEEGLLDGFGIQGTKGVGKTWRKTGIPMLDDAGIVVEPRIWETIKDTNKFLVGDVNYNSILGASNKFNTLWRGLTTAMTANVAGKEIPLNPAYYIRNFLNNKMGAILYGGMDPVMVVPRYKQAMKVWKYIETGEGGDDTISNLKIKNIADSYIKQGGIAGTDISDIKRTIDPAIKNVGGLVEKARGSGDLAQRVEGIDRLMIFLDQKLKGVDDIAAMDKVRFSLFDYGQLTDFEKTSIKPLFAFYTWNKKNMVSFFATLAKDPKRMKIFDDVFKGLGQLADETGVDIEEILPDYLKEAYSVIVGNKNQVGAIYGFGTHAEAVGDIIGRDFLDSARSTISALAPAQRMLIEVASDYNFFKQKPISEDTSAYSFRNVPDSIKKSLGIEGSTFTDKNGKEITTYKMNPMVKYAIENFRPASSILKAFNIATDEGVNNELMLDLLNYLTGIRYQQYDTEYLRRQFENERYKKRMQMLMDEGMVNEYKNYYIPKDK